MQLEGIHHITAITADGPRNVDFYARVLGLRMVKKTVNQDDPSAYHLFYADELGSHGADLTFFEYPGLAPGKPGAGMVERIVHRVASDATLDYWQDRLAGEGLEAVREPGRLLFSDPEGLGHELAVVKTADAPLVARHAEVPAEHALQGFEAVRALVADADPSQALVQALGFSATAPEDWEARGEARGGRISFRASGERGRPGAGTVHHVAWGARRQDLEDWRTRVARAGADPTPVIDRYYFESVYFREPGGILYELATTDGNGFAVDEPLEHLGERLSLPPAYEHLREQIEPVLRPLPDTRPWRPAVTAPVGAER
jgi:glyoxalase family protein